MCLEVDSILRGITKLEAVDTHLEVLPYQPLCAGRRVHIQAATRISGDVHRLIVSQSQLLWAKTMERRRTRRRKSVHHPRGRRKRCPKGIVLLDPTRTLMDTPRVALLDLVARTVLVLLIDLLPLVQQLLDLLLVLLTRITTRVLRMPLLVWPPTGLLPLKVNLTHIHLQSLLEADTAIQDHQSPIVILSHLAEATCHRRLNPCL